MQEILEKLEQKFGNIEEKIEEIENEKIIEIENLIENIKIEEYDFGEDNLGNLRRLEMLKEFFEMLLEFKNFVKGE